MGAETSLRRSQAHSGSRHQFRNNNNNSKNSMGKSGGAAFPVFLLTSAAIAVSYITYLQFKKKDSRGNDDDEEENGWSPTENNAQPLLTSDIDASNAATPQIKPIKQPYDANIDVLDLTPKSANTTQKDTAAATDATKNSITESSTPTKEEKKEKKKKKIRPKIKPITTPQESDNVEASSSDSSNTATLPKDSGEEAQGREVSIRTELGFGEFAHSPPRSRAASKKSLKSSSISKTGSNNDEDEAPKEGANYNEISKYWKSQSTKNTFKAPEKSDAAIRVGSVASSSGSSSNTSGITATVTDDADVHVSEDVEESNAEKSPETTQGSEKEEVAALTPEQPSTEAGREEKYEEGGKVAKAEEVGTAESTLGHSTQAKREEQGGEEKVTETIERQSPEEKIAEPQEKTSEETNKTVAGVDQSMLQDTVENFKTVVDETTIGVEDKAKPEELEGEEAQKEEKDEEEDSQLIVPAASDSGSDSSGGDSNTNTSRSGSPSEDGYVKIVRNTLGVPMSESELLSTPVVVTDKKETHEETKADVEEEGGRDGGKDNVTAATVTGQPQDVKEQEGNEKVNEEKDGLEKEQDEQQVVDNADVGDVNLDGTMEASNQATKTEEKSGGVVAAGGKTTPKKNNKKKKKRKGKRK